MSTPTLGSPSSVRMARSPIFVTGKNNALAADTLDAMSCGVEMYTGAKTGASGADYTLNKTYSIDEVVNFEVSNLVRGNFLHPMGKFNITAPSASEVGEVLWVNLTGDWTYSDNGATPVTAPWGTGTTYAFLATDGWTKRGEAQNREQTDARLTIARTHQVYSSYREALAALYFAGNGLNALSYEIGGTEYWYHLEDELGFANNSNESQNKVIYIPSGVQSVLDFVGVEPTSTYTINLITNSEGADYKTRVEADGGVVEGLSCLMNAIEALGGHDKEAINYEVVCEPKYTPEIIQYTNRYGVSDYLTFFKVSTEQGNFTNDQYKRSIYADAFTEPDFKTAQYQHFNINSRNSITLNTGWVEEAYKDVIEELLMSENVTIYEGGNYRAINPQRGSVEYQKEVNRKVINYTLTFDYAHDERNLIR